MHNYIWCPYYLPSFMKFCSVVSEELCWQTASEVYFMKFQVQRGITPTKFRGSTFPGNIHNFIWCPYYLPSFMKFCLVVSEELHWQAASEVYLGKFWSSKGHNSHKIRGSKFPGNMHNYIWCPYYLPSFMKFCSVVSEELHWQSVMDRTKTICLPTKVGGDIILIRGIIKSY